MGRGNTAPLTEARRAGLQIGVERARRAAKPAARARLQDLEWMAEHGETTEGAAERLGVRRGSLHKWLTGQGRLDLWERFRRNEVRRFGATLEEIHRMERDVKAAGATIGPRNVA